jgi:hypothetical protein
MAEDKFVDSCTFGDATDLTREGGEERVVLPEATVRGTFRPKFFARLGGGVPAAFISSPLCRNNFGSLLALGLGLASHRALRCRATECL